MQAGVIESNKTRESRLERLVMRLEKCTAHANAQGNVLAIIGDRLLGSVPEAVGAAMGQGGALQSPSAVSRLEIQVTALEEALSKTERQINRVDEL